MKKPDMTNQALLSSPEQRQRIYALMVTSGLVDKDLQRELISQYTRYRTDSSKEMLFAEAEELIKALSKTKIEDPSNKMRRKLLHYAHLLGWELKDSSIDMERVDNWCIKYGQFHKPLKEHTREELTKLTTQFEKAFISYLNKL